MKILQLYFDTQGDNIIELDIISYTARLYFYAENYVLQSGILVLSFKGCPVVFNTSPSTLHVNKNV